MNILEETLRLSEQLDKKGCVALAGELDRIVERIISTAKKHRKWEKVAGTSSGYKAQARAEKQEALSGLFSEDIVKQAGIWDAIKAPAQGAWEGLTAPWAAKREQEQYNEYRQYVANFLKSTEDWFEAVGQFANQAETLSPEQINARTDAIKSDIMSSTEDFQNTSQQVMTAAENPAHPNFSFAQHNIEAIEAFLPTIDSVEPLNNDVMGGLKQLNLDIVGGHNTAKQEFNAAVNQQSKDMNQWQQLENYSPLMQLLLRSQGLGRMQDIMGRSSRSAQEIISNPRALQKVVQDYSRSKAMLEEVASWLGTNADGLIQMAQQSGNAFGPASAGAKAAGASDVEVVG